MLTISLSSLFLYGYFVPLILSASIVAFYLYHDVHQDMEAGEEGCDDPNCVITVGDVLRSVLFCVTPVFNWAIPMRFAWDRVKALEHKLMSPLERPLVSKRRQKAVGDHPKRRAEDQTP